MTPTRTLPHPILAAHQAMVAKLAAIIPPRIYVEPDPEEFEATADYILSVSRIMDQWLLYVGQEVKANSSACIDMTMFTDQFLGATEGNATFECSRAADDLRDERAAA